SDFLWAFQNARPGGRVAKLALSLGPRSLATGHGRDSPVVGVFDSDQHHSALHGGEPDLVDGDDAKDRRRGPATSNDVHAADLFVYLLQFRRGFGFVLHNAKPFQYRAILLQQTTTDADAGKARPAGKTKTMTPKELLDTILGYLGFVVEIEESHNDAGNLVLQIYSEESRRLIGRDGETLEALQFLLNRLLQTKDKDAPKVVVDCEMYRSMREDRIVQRVRGLAERVRATGRSLQLEPMNSY